MEKEVSKNDVNIQKKPPSFWNSLLKYVFSLSALFTAIYTAFYYNLDFKYSFEEYPKIYEIVVHAIIFYTLLLIGSIIILIKSDREFKLFVVKTTNIDAERDRQIDQFTSELEELTLRLGFTRNKYIDLLNECDAVVIEFDRMLAKWLSFGRTISGIKSSDKQDAISIVEQLVNPIRSRLVDFKNVAKAAISESVEVSKSADVLTARLEGLRQKTSIEKLVHEQDKRQLEEKIKELRSHNISLRRELDTLQGQAAEMRNQLVLTRNELEKIESLATEKSFDEIIKQKILRLEGEHIKIKSQLAKKEDQIGGMSRTIQYLEHLKVKQRKGKFPHKYK